MICDCWTTEKIGQFKCQGISTYTFSAERLPLSAFRFLLSAFCSPPPTCQLYAKCIIGGGEAESGKRKVIVVRRKTYTLIYPDPQFNFVSETKRFVEFSIHLFAVRLFSFNGSASAILSLVSQLCRKKSQRGKRKIGFQQNFWELIRNYIS